MSDTVVSECKTCGLSVVIRNGERVSLVNWKKNIVAPSPCPECLEESRKAMAELGRRWSERWRKAFVAAMNGDEA